MLVQFKDDPVLFHCRWVLALCGSGRVQALTPDRNVQETDLNDKGTYSNVFRWPTDKLPDKKVKKANLYTDKESERGPFKRGELERFLEKYSASPSGDPPVVGRPTRLRGKQRKPVLPLSAGTEHRGSSTDRSLGDGVPSRRLSTDELADEATTWYCVFSSHEPMAPKPGEPVALPPGGIVSGKICIFTPQGKIIPEIYIELSDAELPAFQRELTALTPKNKEGRGGASAFRQSDSVDGSPLGDESPGEQQIVSKKKLEDVRILPVLLDEGDERWRSLSEAVALLKEVEFPDWPLEGVRSLKYVVKQLKRNNKSWMTSHFDWVRNSGIRGSDRAIHEHRILSKMLELMTCYDQLNILNIAAAELALKRRMLLESAYQGRPEAPHFEGSEHFMGFRDTEAGEYIDPEIVKYRSQKLKEETSVLKEVRLKREEDNAARVPRKEPGKP